MVMTVVVVVVDGDGSDNGYRRGGGISECLNLKISDLIIEHNTLNCAILAYFIARDKSVDSMTYFIVFNSVIVIVIVIVPLS